jgi:hypothetical protein
VSGGVGIGDVSVPSATDDLAIAKHDGTYRDFVHFESALGAAECFFHPQFVGTVVGRWSLVDGHTMSEVILRGPVMKCRRTGASGAARIKSR